MPKTSKPDPDAWMPEIAEVETLRRQLEKEAGGKRIKTASLRSRDYVKMAHAGTKRAVKKTATPKPVSEALEGAKILEVGRRGKFLTFRLDNGNTLVIHLGMSGRIVKLHSKRPDDKHTHLELDFTQGTGIRFFDPRRFGECFICPTSDLDFLLSHVGTDAVEEPIPWTLLADMLAERGVRLKPLLLDQSFIAGIGNIYSDEILWSAGLRYDRKSDSLTRNEVRRLSRAIGEVLQEAIKNRGTTLADEGWKDLYDEVGENFESLMVHGRRGEPCRRCRTPIETGKSASRTTYFCPQCQAKLTP